MKKVIIILAFAVIICAVSISAILYWGKKNGDADPVIYYSDYGAKGDGVTDDFDAIIAAYSAANQTGTKVRANAGAVYYIGSAAKTAVIQTDTDWRGAEFIIDDTNAENRSKWVFTVSSLYAPVKITDISTLQAKQNKLNLSLEQPSVITAEDSNTKRYIRYGDNANTGSAQTDTFIADKDGNVAENTPIIWDFDNITSMTAYPIDAAPLNIAGGRFTTIANRGQISGYFARGIQIGRSNTTVDGLTHLITGEGESGSPYTGFINIVNCAGVTVKNCALTGHKYYDSGSYDISANKSVNIVIKDCTQTNDICDTAYWGIMASNFCKNIVLDDVRFSRFDAHQGVHNAAIINSVLGHQAVSIIGSGTLRIENTFIKSTKFISLRDDYGSSWNGEVIIKNCEYFPLNENKSDFILVRGSNSGQHNFGYDCHMPYKITIDGLWVHDGNAYSSYKGLKLFGNFGGETGEDDTRPYPLTVTKEVYIRNLKTDSGKGFIKCAEVNEYMFRNVQITVGE
jgi:hypothetical protein